MKILLREHRRIQYGWWTTKYDGQGFIVNGRSIVECDIVSIINDNRKNYIRCSNCGKIFPKNGKKFEKHKAESSSLTPCFGCHRMRTRELSNPTKKYVSNSDGTYTEKYETRVELECSKGLWVNWKCNSSEAINDCVYRQCAKANEEEITDIFLELPGVFDDIITVDKIIDYGYEEIGYFDDNGAEYLIDGECCLSASINSMGIVNKFIINAYDYYGYIYYSKKYDMFFSGDGNGKYVHWEPYAESFDIEEVKKHIRKIYK